ncbi:MAG: phytanoyl-CoA dioxygenase family protein [Alphaproteobacteria bacterium]
MSEIASFVDSTELSDDGPALAARLAEDGYLFLRGLLPRDEVMAVRARLLELAAAGGWLDPDQPVEAGIARPEAACKDPEPEFLRVYGPMWKDEALHGLRLHPDVTGLFERILGEAVLTHPMFVLRSIFPQREDFDFTTGMHQDKVHIGGATNHALWVPLGDCPREKGSLAVAAGSHKAGVLDFEVGSGAGGMSLVGPIPGTWVGGDFEAGDGLIFSDTTVHKALPNRSGEIRQSFDARYQAASQPIAERELKTYADMFAWEEVYEGWESSEHRYYWRKLEPRIMPFDNSYYERRDTMAFEMAARGETAARDALLRIIQRDSDGDKRVRARALLARLDAAA